MSLLNKLLLSLRNQFLNLKINLFKSLSWWMSRQSLKLRSKLSKLRRSK